MIAVLQRVESALVTIDGAIKGKCGQGLLILLGVAKSDSESDAVVLADKISKLRIFSDEAGKMNLSVADINGSALVISNFTLCADYKKGNRPDYFNAADPEIADNLYEHFITLLRDRIGNVESGEFGADMKISLVNDGPVTITMNSEVLMKKQVTL
jgi:D-tyrosyl-tRNA(Tyr) deacylase